MKNYADNKNSYSKSHQSFFTTTWSLTKKRRLRQYGVVSVYSCCPITYESDPLLQCLYWNISPSGVSIRWSGIPYFLTKSISDRPCQEVAQPCNRGRTSESVTANFLMQKVYPFCVSDATVWTQILHGQRTQNA